MRHTKKITEKLKVYLHCAICNHHWHEEGENPNPTVLRDMVAKASKCPKCKQSLVCYTGESTTHSSK